MTTASELSVRRCAVCRVNMKCRFVYVDDGVEKLVGFTREELFGKSFFDFVDEADRPLLTRIMEQRNHFEANFDITSLHLLTRDQQRIPANVVVSLNFIAGNPVNYQIIIDSAKPESTLQRFSIAELDYRQYVDRLLIADPSGFSADALDALYAYLGDEYCLVYQINGDQMEPIFWQSGSPISGIRVLPEPTALLRWVAMSDEVYDSLDPDSARLAIERCGIAPNEFIRNLKISGECYLVRVLLENIADSANQREKVAAVNQAVSLAERLAPVQIANGGVPSSDGTSVLNDLKSSLASAMRIASMLDKSKSESK